MARLDERLVSTPEADRLGECLAPPTKEEL